jgi:deoxycytidylate deaminase
VRRNAIGELRNAMPCSECCKTLKKLGFRKVAYSTNSSEMHIVDMRTFTNNHLSGSQKITAIHSKAL